MPPSLRPRKPPKRLRAAAGLLALIGCFGCTPPRVPPAKNPPPQLRVVTTTLPLTLITRAVAGSCAEVVPLFADGGDVHHPQLSPAQVARVAEADVLVSQGAGLETFLPELRAAADRGALRVIEAARGLPTLPGSSQAASASVDHGDEDDAHSHGGGRNPHLWLDPQLLGRQVVAVRDGLIAADPTCRTTFTTNAAHFGAGLARLDAELSGRLAPFAGRRFVTSHAFATYFARRYRLREVALVDSPEQSPSPADLQRVLAVARAERLRALLAASTSPPASLASLASDLGIPVLPFDPMETSPSGAENRPEHYFETLRRNAASVEAALGGGASSEAATVGPWRK